MSTLKEEFEFYLANQDATVEQHDVKSSESMIANSTPSPRQLRITRGELS